MKGVRGFCNAASDTFHAAKEAMSTHIDLKTGLGVGVALTGLNAWVVNLAVGGVKSEVLAVGTKVDAKVQHSLALYNLRSV